MAGRAATSEGGGGRGERQARQVRQARLKERLQTLQAANERERNTERARQRAEHADLLPSNSTGSNPTGSNPTSRATADLGRAAAAAMDRAEDAPMEPVRAEKPSQKPTATAGSSVDKSGWLLKTGPSSMWQPAKWSARLFVLSGGSLSYYRPQVCPPLCVHASLAACASASRPVASPRARDSGAWT